MDETRPMAVRKVADTSGVMKLYLYGWQLHTKKDLEQGLHFYSL